MSGAGGKVSLSSSPLWYWLKELQERLWKRQDPTWKSKLFAITKVRSKRLFALLTQFCCSLDTAVLEKLHGLDDGVLNPAITSIVSTILGAKDKTEGFVGPILEKILGPLGLLKDKPESESTLKPDGTTTSVKVSAK